MTRTPHRDGTARKGRGAVSNRTGRFEALERGDEDDGWGSLDVEPPPLETRVEIDTSKSIVAHNDSPDVPFTSSVNPYRGCEHGCIYCFARPTHAYLGLSAGLDFESRLFYKPSAAQQLRDYLGRRGYVCDPITLGANTDPYQPIERRLGVTRALVEVLAETRHPLSIVTKSALVERDLDLLGPMAAEGFAGVCVSITTLDHGLARRMEPRASAPRRRVETVRRLSEAGVPVTVLIAPVIPFLNDQEIERILEAVSEAGAVDARYTVVRLPLEIHGLFEEWLQTHYPLKAERVLNNVRSLHGGKIYDSTFGLRQRGQGELSALLARRFEVAHRRLGFPGASPLDCSKFVPPAAGGQLSLL